MIRIAEEARTKPELLHHAPFTMPVNRLDEVTAARRPNLRWTKPADPPETDTPPDDAPASAPKPKTQHAT
jgi:hypothetical protein